jgi:hypothetical protein
MTDDLKKKLNAELENVTEDAKTVAEGILKLVELLENMPARIEAAAQAAGDRADAGYRILKEAHDKLDAKLKRLEGLPEVAVPYGVERMLEIAQRCQDLSDKGWERLRDLARVMNEDQQRELEEQRERRGE